MTDRAHFIAESAFDTTVASVSSKVTYTGTGITIAGYMTLNEFAAVAGIVLGVLGFVVNWIYKHKADQRAAERDRWERDRLLGREAP